jgi:hypothetical protein
MIEHDGIRCDVCGEFILIENAASFHLGFIENTLTAHTRTRDCIGAIKAACEADDITLLPDGPIRRAYEKAVAADTTPKDGE